MENGKAKKDEDNWKAGQSEQINITLLLV